jgi:hypothetical protein
LVLRTVYLVNTDRSHHHYLKLLENQNEKIHKLNFIDCYKNHLDWESETRSEEEKTLPYKYERCSLTNPENLLNHLQRISATGFFCFYQIINILYNKLTFLSLSVCVCLCLKWIGIPLFWLSIISLLWLSDWKFHSSLYSLNNWFKGRKVNSNSFSHSKNVVEWNS